MYLIFIVHSLLLVSVKSNGIPSSPLHRQVEEYKQLHMTVESTKIDQLSENSACEGQCEINHIIINLLCEITTTHRTNESILAFNVTTVDNVTKEHNGQWICNYTVDKQIVDAINYTVEVKPVKIVETNTISTPTTTATPTTSLKQWTYIAAGVGTLVLLVIVGQTIFIVHLKRKAKEERRGALWNRDDEDNECKDVERYSNMPGHKLKEDIPLEDRGSRIYEALEAIRPDVPLPPPIESLPTSKPPTSVLILKEPPAEVPMPKGLNSLLGRKKKKKKDVVEPELDSKPSTHERNKERPRLPLPGDEIYEAVSDEPNILPPPRRDFRKKFEMKTEPQKKEILPPPENARDFGQPRTKPAAPVPGMAAPNSMAVPNQLREALEQRMRMNTLGKNSSEPAPLLKTHPTPKLPHQTNSPILPKKPWQKEPSNLTREPFLPREKRPIDPLMHKAAPFLPREKVRPIDPSSTTSNNSGPYVPRDNPWPEPPTLQAGPYARKESPSLPRAKAWPEPPTSQTAPYVSREKQWPEPTSPKTAPYVQKEGWPKPLPPKAEMSKEMLASTTKLAGFNPGLPPPDAPPAKMRTPWGETLSSKPRPAPPKKPKQLHPLPNPPSEPDPDIEHTDYEEDFSNSDESDGEDWTYEPLPQFNIYSL